MRLIDADKLNEALVRKSDELHDIGESSMSGAVMGVIGIVNRQPEIDVSASSALEKAEEKHKQLLHELCELAIESVAREKKLAKLEAEVNCAIALINRRQEDE